MNKRGSSAVLSNSTETYRQMLIEKRDRVVSGLGAKFDTIAKMGRVAEEDLDYGQLRLVEEALDRVQSGDFGVCLACEQPIPPKRLQAVPWARYCVPCQEAIGMMQPDDLAEARPRL
jgi:hypothetical protein